MKNITKETRSDLKPTAPSPEPPEERVNEPGKDDLLTAQGLVEQTKENLKISLGKIESVTGQKVELVSDNEPEAAAKNLRIVALAVKAYKKAVMEAARGSVKDGYGRC